MPSLEPLVSNDFPTEVRKILAELNIPEGDAMIDPCYKFIDYIPLLEQYSKLSEAERYEIYLKLILITPETENFQDHTIKCALAALNDNRLRIVKHATLRALAISQGSPDGYYEI